MVLYVKNVAARYTVYMFRPDAEFVPLHNGMPVT